MTRSASSPLAYFGLVIVTPRFVVTGAVRRRGVDDPDGAWPGAIRNELLGDLLRCSDVGDAVGVVPVEWFAVDDARVPDVRAQVALDDVDDGLGVADVHGELELDRFLEDQLEDVLVERAVDVRLVVPVQEHAPTAVRTTTLDDCVEPVHVLGSHQVLGLVDEDGVVGPVRRQSRRRG